MNSAQRKTIELEIAALTSLLEDGVEDEDERQATVNILTVAADALLGIALELREQ